MSETAPETPPAGPRPPRESVAAMRIHAPTERNPKLARFLEAANASDKLKARWLGQQVTAERLEMSDHSWVHLQIVLNRALHLFRLLHRSGLKSSIETDYAMSHKDAEVIIAGGCLLHDLGMSIHRIDHEAFSLFLAADLLDDLLAERLRGPRADRDRVRGPARDHRPPQGRAAADVRGGRGARGRRAGHGARPLARQRRDVAGQHPLAQLGRDRRGPDRPRRAARRPRRGPDEQLRGRLPGRLAAGQQAARLRPRDRTSKSSPASTRSTRSACCASTRSSRRRRRSRPASPGRSRGGGRGRRRRAI